MREIVGESLANRLVAWGVDTVFGLPGDGINGVMEGLRRCQDKIRFVLVYHEEAAAFMATGYAKSTGRLGAIRTALSRRTVAHLTFLNDVQVAPIDTDPFAHVAPATSPATAPIFRPSVPNATHEDVQSAADLLNESSKIAMLVGAGAMNARDEVLAVAERLGSPIVKSLPGKAVVPDDRPLTTGGPGLLGTKPSELVMDECDTLLMVGTSFPYTKHLPAPGKVRMVQIDTDPTRVGLRLPTELPIVADAKSTLQALLPRLHQHDHDFLSGHQRKMDEWRRAMDALEDPNRDPIAPQYLAACIDEAAADGAILTCDSGTVATWAARHWTIRGQREFYLSGNLATMAPGLPYAIADQLAFPDRQVIAFVGDGGFAMLMAEFLTAVRYGLPIKVVINNNNSYGQILWEQILLGYPEYSVRFREPEADFSTWARGTGAFGVKVSKPGDLAPAIHEAFSHAGPALVDCDVDPNEPPMPPQVSYDQAKHFTEAFLHGQPHRAATLTAVAREKITELRS